MAADRAPVGPTLARRSMLAGSLGLLALGALPALTGCGPSSAGAAPAVHGLDALPADFARVAAPLNAVHDLAEVVAGMAAFGQHLHRVSAEATDNFTSSPLSIAVAFGMARAGARGRTGSQIDSVFGFPPGGPPQGSPHHALNALTASFVTDRPVATGPEPVPSHQPGPAPIVAMANALFVEKSFGEVIVPAFLRLLATEYGAHAQAVEFRDGSAEKLINAWVREQTRERIKKLFDKLDPTTQLVLADAVYLKAAWLNQFTAQSTTSADFTTASGSRVPAKLMRQQLDRAAYAETAEWQRVTLPYIGGELAMRVVLPRKPVADVATLNALLPVATRRTADDQAIIDLSLPRWDTGTDLDLVRPLIELGMPDAFGAADFSGLARGLWISQAIHRANITVDEHGTEAAAVTGIAFESSAVVGEPKTMRVDRPFVWAVVHEPTGAPVFVGHVVDPGR